MNRIIAMVIVTVGVVPHIYAEKVPKEVSDLLAGAGDNDVAKIRAALDAGADVNYQGDYVPRTALMLAAGMCNAEAVEELLTNPKSQFVINVNLQDRQGGWTAYRFAQFMCPAISNRIQSAGAMKPDDMLMAAIESSNLAGVQAALKTGGNPTLKTADKKTLLHLASAKGNKPVVEFLIQDGKAGRYFFDVNAKDSEGKTALHYAAASGSGPVVDALIKAGAGVNSEDNAKKTPIEYAANELIKQRLTAAGAD